MQNAAVQAKSISTLWMAQNETITRTIDGVTHQIELIDVAQAADACGFKVDGDTVWIDVGEDETLNGVYLSVLDAQSSPDLCKFQMPYMLLWNSTTDSDGYVNIEITYNESNYDLPRYITMYGNKIATINITTDTPLNLSYNYTPHLTVASRSPLGDYTAYYYSTFTYNISTLCIDGDCGDVTLTLDPFAQGIKKTKTSKESVYESFRQKQLQDINGVIVEFRDEPLIKEYLRLRKEIKYQESELKDRNFFFRKYSEYKLNKLKRDFPKKIKESKISLLEKQAAAKRELFEHFNINEKQVGHEYHSVINGISISISGERLEKLQKLTDSRLKEHIKAIHPIQKKTILLNESLSVISAPQAWGVLDEHGNNVTGINTTIAIIDTGIDYTHADLGSCSESQFLAGTCAKVVDGYDFVNYDNNPIDDQGHGTHCAGIAAGNGALKGAAPDAQLYAYKVLDEYGSGWEDDIIAGIELAMDPNNDSDYSDHVDVISMSLGGAGEPFDALSTACSNAAKAGVIVVVAAGNSGPYEESIGCPGCAPDVITVGASYKNNYPVADTNASLFVINDSNQKVEATAFYNSVNTSKQGVAARLMYAGNGSETEFQALNYSGKIALVDRGLYFDDIIWNAENADCAGVIVSNNYPGMFSGYLSEESLIPVVAVSQSDGEYLYNISQVPLNYVNITIINEYAIVAEFSSRGPAYIYNKPDILAPGVDICSARLDEHFSDSLCIDTEHASLSGTSMATPHVAGVAALIRQKHPEWSHYQIKAAIEYTAQDLGLDMNVQGAGIINASAAVSLEHAPPVAFIHDLIGVEYR